MKSTCSRWSMGLLVLAFLAPTGCMTESENEDVGADDSALKSRAPTVHITSPTAGAIVAGTITVNGDASDDRQVAKVEVRIDSEPYALANGTTSWSYAWNTSAAPDGAHTITARATDNAGRTRTTSVSVTVQNGATTSTPCAGVTVDTSDNLAALISTNPPGTTFCISGGIHRIELQGGYAPLDGDVFIGVGTTAVISGAKQLTGWTSSGSNFVATGMLPTAPSSNGPCDGGHPLCKQQHDIFRDGVWLEPVSSLAALAPGKAYVDYANDKVYVRDDPNGHLMEQSWATKAFGGAGRGVQLRNLTIEKTATVYQTGAISPSSGGTGWLIDHDDIRWNHGYGLGPGADTGFTATNNHIHHNGEIGTGGDGPNVRVESNEVDHNNVAGYDPMNEGSNKFGHTINMVVRGNYYHDDFGPGIWCDINCQSALIENNYVAHEYLTGIFYEISCGSTTNPALIRNNVVVGCGTAQIEVSGSNDVEVAGNQVYTDTVINDWTKTVPSDQRGIWGFDQGRTDHVGACGPHEVRDLYVHDNLQDLNGPSPTFAGKTGMWTDTSLSKFYTTLNNRFVHNAYHATSPSDWWDWNLCGQYGCQNTFSQFQALGQDTTGSLTADNPTPPPPPVLVVGPQP